MHRSYVGSMPGFSPRVIKHRSDYLFVLQNLQTNEELLPRALGLLGVLASEEDILQLCQELNFPAAAQTEVKADCLSDRSELFDRLAYLSPRVTGSKDQTKLRLARKLIRSLLRKTQPGLRWQDNAFLSYLRKNLPLSPEELQLLWVLYLRQSSRELDFLNMGISDLADELDILEACFGMESQVIGELTLRESTLVKTGLIEQNGDTVKLPARVLLAIAGNISIAAFQAENFIKDSYSTYELDSFDLNPIDIEIILALLRSEGPANILLFGRPGAGKTEAARSLIRRAGLDVLHVPVHATGGRHSRLTRLRYADHFSQGSALIVDEAELILNNAVRFIAFESDSTPSKSVLNTYLDSSQSKTIWILNDTNHLHESTMRRFHFKLHFDKLSRKQRSHALDLIARKHGIEALVSPETSNRLLSEEHLSPGVLNQMAHALVQTTKKTPAIEASAIIDRLLSSNRPVDAPHDDEARVHEAYSLDALNLSISAERIIQDLKSFLALPRRPRNGLNLLFHGLPGTGKTELARYLSHCLNRDLIIKRGSDLLGMYVGSTEQSIAAAFKQAQRSEAILLIDEADTFFRSRADARQSYEISHTNEFLNQMENHRGIVICCTNMIDSLDAAAMRRFALKIEFKPIQSENLPKVFIQIFRGILTQEPPRTELQSAMRDLEGLTPGDFALVLRVEQLHNSSRTWQELVAKLECELKHKHRQAPAPIGFR